jgi:hypothetical protein
LKPFALALLAGVFGVAIACGPAQAVNASGHGGGPPGGGFGPSPMPPQGGGGGFSLGHGPPGGGALSGGSLSHPNLVPSGNFASHPSHVPYTDPSWSKSGNQHQRFARHPRHRHGWGGGVIAPALCDDAYCDNGYYYDDSDCWVLRRVYNRYGKFAGWRRVYVCQNGQ